MKLLLILIVLIISSCFVKSSSSSSSSSTSSSLSSSSSSSENNKYILYQNYDSSDFNCSAEVVLSSYVENGMCDQDNNISYQCNKQENTFTVTTWEYSNCTGRPGASSSIPLNSCISGSSILIDCVNEVEIQQDTFMSIISDTCNWKNDFISVSAAKTNTCVNLNGVSTFITCNQTHFSQEIYQNGSSCTSNPIESVSEPIPECSANINNNMVSYLCI